MIWIRIFWLSILSLMMSCGNKKFDIKSQTRAFKGYVEVNNKVDILWVLDNSSSMERHQELLSQQVDFFMKSILKGNYDFHIGVIHTDMTPSKGPGVLLGNPSVLTSSTSDVQSLLQEKFQVGDTGTNFEQGLAAMEAALSPDYLQGVNQGFLRQEASLVVIFLSDEDDHSSEEVTHYIQILNQLKGASAKKSRGWDVHFIGVLEDSLSCTTMNDYSEVGQRYMEMVNESGGAKESICAADFSTALSRIQSRIVSVLTDFPLDRRPIIESIQVWTNDVKVPQNSENGWVYLADKNAVSFRGSFIPKNGAKIRVDFTPVSVFE